MTKQTMTTQVLELMSMVTPSGNEAAVREYLQEALKEFGITETVTDSYGNLLAEKVVGDGVGATITLSAHMDSVNNYSTKKHTLINDAGIIRAKDGICGADDKAGIAIALEALRNIPQSFTGKIKLAFFVEEEVGCVGSSRAATNESKPWIADSDLAIVIDRRGNRDIVVGNFSQTFCSTPTGELFEHASDLLEMNWACVEGGISDTANFAELNVNAVNLSAGYRNEHTRNEWVSVHDMFDTVKLIVQVMALLNTHVGTLGDVPEENKWIKAYSHRNWDYNGYDNYGTKWEYSYDQAERDIYGVKTMATIRSVYGHTYIDTDTLGEDLFITQGSGSYQQEIMLTSAEFEGLVRAYYDKKYNVKSTKDAKAVKGGVVNNSKELVEDDLPF